MRRIIFVTAILLIIFISNNNQAQTLKVNRIFNKILILRTNDDFKDISEVLSNLNKYRLKDSEYRDLYLALLDYNIGEGCTDILLENIINMDYKILPYLVEKRHKPMTVQINKTKFILLDMETRNHLINSCIETIRNNNIEESDTTKSSTMGNRLNILSIFLKDYKIIHNNYPRSLDSLRVYVDSTYGYNLIIYDDETTPYYYKTSGKYFRLKKLRK